jgi:lysosomal alpha-mannosidase
VSPVGPPHNPTPLWLCVGVRYVEMVYFRRWWLEQTAETHTSVRMLVTQRRLVFLTGGLCMNDEATPFHGEIIDQMTWGHRFINATFGPEALPTVSWQIDSFGHSAGYASLAATMGLRYFIGQKIDTQEQARRAAAHQLEFVWTPDAINFPNRTVLSHLLYDNTMGYSYMIPNVTSDPEAAVVADALAASIATRQARYSHPDHVLFLFGGDFVFQDAPMPFESMERVMA